MAQFSPWLGEQGLNLQAVFSLDMLPESVRQALEDAVADLAQFRQLLLLGHGGRRLWQSLVDAGYDTADPSGDPVDDFTVVCVERFFSREHPDSAYRILYPGGALVPLQQLGQLAGWHFPSPFMVGVNDAWGSWYAYRAVVLANTHFSLTQPPGWRSACDPCVDKPCVTACPAQAVAPQGLDMARCITFRKKPDSPCQRQCLARLACPVGETHRYNLEQLEYHYWRSYCTLRDHY